MAVYTRRIAADSLADGTPKTLFVAPAGEVTIVRDVILANTASTAITVLLYMHKPGGGDVWLAHPKLEVDGVYHLELRQELLSGESLIGVSFGGLSTVAVTAYRFLA